ncbi:MAG TPA: 50S ribosomal protein L9 [Rhodospirillales bacterium]|nr:50S ribosomal protein L9 [Rhodospirillales bacterium]
MDVILLERIEKLGQMGDIVSVKTGYARNYLLPGNKALRATEENRSQFEAQKVQLEAINLERRKEAEDVGAKLDGLCIILVRQAGEAGQLYGSVSSRDVSDAVTGAGFTIARAQVRLEKPIKTIGLHQMHIDLHPEVAIGVTVNVARSEDEAKTQAKTGKAVLDSHEEEEIAAEDAVEEIFEDSAAPEHENEEETAEVAIEEEGGKD